MPLLLILVNTVFARPLWGSADLDNDGVRDRDDACVRIPETENQWMDDDGCPDTLSAVTVASSFQTMIEENAQILLTVEGETTRGTGTLTVDELVPGTEVTVAAGYGCHAAQSTFIVEPRHHKVRLKLEPRLFTEVELIVRSSFGEPVESATVTFLESEPAGCAPREPVRMAGGYGRLLLGRGMQTLAIQTSDGARTQVVLEVGRDRMQKFVDMPPPGGRESDGGRLLAQTVYFEDGEESLSEDAQRVVQEVARYLIDNPELGRVTVEGHADERAWGPYNDELSERRAEAVRDALVTLGVPAGRLVVVGRGEKEPIDDRHNPTAWAKNRRVHFVVRR
jgi:outer membrane protein OmpA-like peptidoglycan-associated protein